MNVIKEFRKTIALVLVIAFLSLTTMSCVSLRAEEAPTTPTAAKAADEGTGSVEQPSPYYQPQKKSSPIVPILIGVVVIGVVAVVLVLVVFKTKYDITGTWTLNWQYTGYEALSNTITFTGDKKTGTFSIGSAYGTYTVDGKSVSWHYSTSETTYTGSFTSKTHMSGTMISNGFPGTWYADKLGASAPASARKDLTGEAKVPTSRLAPVKRT